MEKVAPRIMSRRTQRRQIGLGGAVVGGMLSALMVGNAAAQSTAQTGPEHLSKAITAIENGDGKSAIPGLQSMTENGDAEAGFLLGSVWHKGVGVGRDFAKARAAYATAAFLGHPKAMNELGLLYRDGLGVVADPIEAIAWFRVASEFNLTEAMENRNALETGMSDRDRAAGRALALRRELEIDLISRDKLGAPPKMPTRVARDASTRDIALAMLRQESKALPDVKEGSTAPSGAAETAAPAETTTKVPAPETFLIQIGVFAKPASVQRIREEAEGLGLTVQETVRTVAGKTATRLTAGPFTSENAAKQAAAKLDAALKVTTRILPAAS